MIGIILAIIAVIIIVVLVLSKRKAPVVLPPPPPPPPPPTVGGPAPLPEGVHLTLVVQTLNVSVADVAAYLAAQQAQIDLDFSPAWGGSAVIDQKSGGWPVYLKDVSDVQGALGYHDVDQNGVPFAKVFVQTSKNAGINWQSVASHEVLETLADANVNTTDLGADGCQWYQEVGDPVEDKAYARLGVVLSDFATPAWFTPGAQAPYDFLGVLTAPFTVTAGGYAIEVCNGKTITVGGAAAISVDKAYE